MSTHFRGFINNLRRQKRVVHARKGNFTTEVTENPENLVGHGALQEFSEGLAEGKDLSEVVGSEIGAGGFYIGAFAADLYDADDAIAGDNRSADDFLNDFRAFGRQFYAFENAGVFNGAEIVDDFRAALPRSAGGERGFAGERDEADVSQRFRHDEVQMLAAMGDTEDGYFVGADGKVLGDAFRDRGEGNLRVIAGFAIQRVREAFQCCCQIHVFVQKLRRATCGQVRGPGRITDAG